MGAFWIKISDVFKRTAKTPAQSDQSSLCAYVQKADFLMLRINDCTANGQRKLRPNSANTNLGRYCLHMHGIKAILYRFTSYTDSKASDKTVRASPQADQDLGTLHHENTPI